MIPLPNFACFLLRLLELEQTAIIAITLCLYFYPNDDFRSFRSLKYYAEGDGLMNFNIGGDGVEVFYEINYIHYNSGCHFV